MKAARSSAIISICPISERRQGPDSRKRARLRLPDRLWPANRPDHPKVCAAAEEQVPAIGLEARYGRSGRHLQYFQDFSRRGIDPSQFTGAVFPGAVPEISVHPADPGDMAVGLDAA